MSDRGPNPTFGAWLKSQRRSVDLTQEALADKAGCSVEMVRKVEAGSARPSRQLAELLASSVGVAAEEIPSLVDWARLGRYEPPPRVTTSADRGSSHASVVRGARVPVVAIAFALAAFGIVVVTGAVLLDRRPAGTSAARLTQQPGGTSSALPVATRTDARPSAGVRDAPTPDPLDVRRPLPLALGRYRLTVFRPQLEFTIAEEGWTLAAESTDVFELGRYGDTSAPDAYISGHQIQVVFDFPCPTAPTHTLAERPRALIEWLQGNGHISVSNPRPVSFAGFTGLGVDIEYASGPGEECAPFESEAERTRLHLFPVGQVTFKLDPGERARVISVDVEGWPLTILVGTYNSDHYDDFQEIARPVVESIHVNP